MKNDKEKMINLKVYEDYKIINKGSNLFELRDSKQFTDMDNIRDLEFDKLLQMYNDLE